MSLPKRGLLLYGAIVADNDIVIIPLDKHCNENNLSYDSFSLEIDNSYFLMRSWTP